MLFFFTLSGHLKSRKSTVTNRNNNNKPSVILHVGSGEDSVYAILTPTLRKTESKKAEAKWQSKALIKKNELGKRAYFTHFIELLAIPPS